MAYSTIIFDLDGTLADTSPGIISSTRAAERELGYRAISDKELQGVIGPPLRESLGRLYGLDEAQTEEMITIYRRHYWAEGVLDIRVYDGMSALLETLRTRGCKLAVATMKLYRYSIKTLEGVGLANCFDAVEGYDDETKPTKAGLILRAMERVGTRDKTAVLMIGDSVYDSQGAFEAGVDFVAMTNGFGFSDPEVLGAYPSVARAASTAELAAFLLPRLAAGEPDR